MKFSLIVPVYNVEQYLDKCLSSIFSNEFKDFEVIIINDGTKDNSEKIIKKYLKKYKNITYIKQENKGLSSARNEGVKRANGEYLLFIDSDDYIEKDMLSTIVKYLDDNPDILRYQLREIYNNKVVDCNENGFGTMTGVDAFSKITRYKYIEVSQLYIYKASFFKKNKFVFKEGIYHEDFALIPIIISKAKTVKSISYIGYNYLQREGSIMNDNNNNKIIKKMNDSIIAYEDAIKKLEKIENSDNVKHFYANSIINKYNRLPKKYKKEYKNKLEELKIFDYIMTDNFKRKIKRVVYKFKFNIGL